ncbi:hypothetical protein [Curtobacterium sp. L1-20]|uniref:hypothetical protein n=1 Tax=Curtobacterium sp. L1-20 TaxID=3138181 RepID=UPI003B52F14B
MSDNRLHQNAPRSRWPRRGLILARNTGVGFAGGVLLWIVALLFGALVSLVSPGMGPHAAAGAWAAAWTPSGFLFAGAVIAAGCAMLTVAIWWAIDQRRAAS